MPNSKEEFIKQYVLNRALAHAGGLEAISAAEQAEVVWEKYLKEQDKEATPQLLNEDMSGIYPAGTK